MFLSHINLLFLPLPLYVKSIKTIFFKRKKEKEYADFSLACTNLSTVLFKIRMKSVGSEGERGGKLMRILFVRFQWQ